MRYGPTSRAGLGGPEHRSLDSGSLSIFHFWRFSPIAFRELRINDQIRVPQVRLFDGTTDEAFGVVPLDKAKQLAIERELDLVEVAPQAQPPVCRLMDYGRYKFEELKKEKESRRGHNVITVKEMKLRPRISEHDFQTKFGYVRHFLQEGDKVKLTIMFRGREMVHQDLGRKLLDRMAAELREVAAIERNPLVEGRNMTMILSPLAKKQSKPAGKPENGQAQSVDDGPTPAAAAAPATAPVAAEGSGEKSDAEDQKP